MWMSRFSTIASSSTEAFSCGNSRSARTAACTTKGRKVRLYEFASWKARLCLSRTAATPPMSTSATVPTWGLVRLEYTMCSATSRRSGDIGITLSPSWIA